MRDPRKQVRAKDSGAFSIHLHVSVDSVRECDLQLSAAAILNGFSLYG